MKYIYTLILFTIALNGYSQEPDEFFKTDSTIDFENECIRSTPEPLVDKHQFPDATFRLENEVGFETVVISDTETLILKNTGCESYVLVLRFEVPSQERKTDDVTFWYKRLVKLVSEVSGYIDSPVNLKEANGKLINYIDDYDNQPLKLGQYITIYDGDIPEVMAFQKIKNIGEDKVALELSIWVGPL